MKTVVLTGPTEAQDSVKRLEELFQELANVKAVEYTRSPDEMKKEERKHVSVASEDNLHVLVNTYRDEELLGEGLMRDLARRIQALRKQLGFSPTEILDSVYLTNLDRRSSELLKPHLKTMAELVRTKRVHIRKTMTGIEASFHKYKVDSGEVYIAIHQAS